MAQKKDGGESTASKTKSNKSTKKTSKSKETVHKPVIKSSEIIVDSDAESEIQVGAPVDDSEKNAPKESVSNKSRSSPNDKTQEPKRPLGESNEDGDGFSTTKSREKSQTSANHEDRQVQRKGGVENSDNVPNQSRQGLKRKMPEHGNTSAPPPAFQPPKGFESAETPSTLSAPLLQPLRPLNLQGKQIWHIIAPANLPMSAVGEIALDKAKEGEPVTSHKGTTYGLKQIDEPENEYEQVLIPNEGGEGLRPVRSNVTKTIHVHQQLSVPDISFTPKMELRGTGASSCLRLPRSKPPPRQKTGLKMRYMPSSFASASCTIGSSDSEVEEAQPQQNGAHQSAESHVQVEGRQEKPAAFKHPEDLKHEVNGDSPEKPKKKKKPEQDVEKSDTKPAKSSKTAKKAKAGKENKMEETDAKPVKPPSKNE